MGGLMHNRAFTIAARMLLAALALGLAGTTAAQASPRAGARGRSLPTARARRQVPVGFMGVVADGPLLDGSVSLRTQAPKMARVGLETLGVSFNWSDVQPFANENDAPAAARSAYPPQGGVPTSFRVTDAEVLAAARSGMGVFPVVVHAPFWARLDPQRDFSPPADPAAYARFLRLLVTRYGPAGTFWSAHREVRAHPIRAWQVWNEPAGGLTPDSPSVFWDAPPPFQPRYVALLHAAHDAIKSADPGAQVVLAALVGRSWETLQTLYDAGAAPYFDTVSLHPYTGLAKNVVAIPRSVRAVMRRNGDRRKPIVVSELGWPSFDGNSVSQLGERQLQLAQSEWLRGALNTLIGARAELGLRQILVYSWISRDLSRTYAFDYAGLEHLLPDGHILPKTAVTVVAKIARRIEGLCSPSHPGRSLTGC
jgi:hypothetical protein